MRSRMRIGICIVSIRLPGPTNSTCGRLRSRSRIKTHYCKREKVMGLQNEKIAALPFVTADLNYLAPTSEKPRNYTYEPPAGVPRSNIVPEPHVLPVHDARPILESVSLDREGFALVNQQSAVR